jgi:precorrin-4/cobalt-precorrin-4 C11-methyltransferase
VTVHFVGAGPGAADLLTLRAHRLLSECPVCLYAGSLIPEDVLTSCPKEARLIDTSRLVLEEIVAVMTEAHRDGHDVVRLCSGDPSVFSAVTEQARRLAAAGVPYDIVPGVPAFAAAAAVLHAELTVPAVAQSVVLTRIAREATPMPPGEQLGAFAATGATLVLHLAVQAIDDIVAELLPHYGPDCPAAVVARASHPDEHVVRAPLGGIAERVGAAGVRRTAVVLVGRALAAEGGVDSHLYSAARRR